MIVPKLSPTILSLPVTALGTYFGSVSAIADSLKNEGRSEISAAAVTLPAGSGGETVKNAHLKTFYAKSLGLGNSCNSILAIK